jgi:signal transduction histidine kinase
MRNMRAVLDAALAAGLAAVTVLQGFDDDSGRWRDYDALGAALSLLVTLPVAARRRAPVPVLLNCYVFWVWQILLGYNPAVTTYGTLLAMYTVAATQPWRRTAALFAPLPVIWVAAGVHGHAGSVAGLLLQGLVVPAVIWKVGDSAKQLAQANGLLHRDREERARRAVTDERMRIARELHDVVAHHMSVVAVQAGLARYVLRADPGTAEAAIGTVLDTSAEALDEMRRMLALLRVGTDADGERPAAYDPAPGLADLPDLFERVRAAGVPVRVVVTGEPRSLPPGVQLCAYRVVQESLTNVLKHAAPATATVTLDHRPGRFTATVRDDGARHPPPAAEPAGHGLIGMRERAMLYGGTLDAAPLAAGGFEVRLVLPLRGEGDDRAR